MERYFYATIEKILNCVNRAVPLKKSDVIFTEFTTQIDTLTADAISDGYDLSVVDSARSAVCIFVDEFINGMPEVGSYWVNKNLQQYYYNTKCGGDLFFLRLNYLLNNPDESLAIYYLCLKLGFRGQYKIQKETHIIRNLIILVENVLSEFNKMIIKDCA